MVSRQYPGYFCYNSGYMKTKIWKQNGNGEYDNIVTAGLQFVGEVRALG